jgi:sulfite exporter TauE/SafE
MPVSFLIYMKDKTNIYPLHYFIFLMPVGLEITSQENRFIVIDNILSFVGRISIYMLIGFLVANIIKNIQDTSLRNIYRFVMQND